MSDGLWNAEPESLGPDWAVLCNMIRQGEEVRVRKCRSFMLIVVFLLAAAWVGPGRSALQSAEQWCKRRYGRIHQVGKMSFCDKNMHKGRLKQHTKGSETGNHPQKVPRLLKRAPVMSERQPLCRRECNSIGIDGFGETNRKHLCQSQSPSHKKVEDKGEVFIVGL